MNKVDGLIILLIILTLWYLTFLAGRIYQSTKTLDYIQEQILTKYNQESKWFYDKRNKKHIKKRFKEISIISK